MKNKNSRTQPQTDAARQPVINGYRDKNDRFVRHGSITVYFPNGGKALNGRYLHGKPHGIWHRWYEDGQKMSQHHYVLGELHGTVKQWYTSGKVAFEGTYKKGQPTDTHHVWSQENSRDPKNTYSYKNGNRIKSRQKYKDRELTISINPSEAYNANYSQEDLPCYAEKIALQPSQGVPIAASIESIVGIMSQIMTPREVEQYLSEVNRIYEENGLDQNKKMLVKCPNGWSSVAIEANSTDTNPTQVSPSEIKAIDRSCRIQAVKSLHAFPEDEQINGEAWRAFVEQEIARVDNLFEQCKDDQVEPIVATIQSGQMIVPPTSIQFLEPTPNQPDENDADTRGQNGTEPTSPDIVPNEPQEKTPDQASAFEFIWVVLTEGGKNVFRTSTAIGMVIIFEFLAASGTYQGADARERMLNKGETKKKLDNIYAVGIKWIREGIDFSDLKSPDYNPQTPPKSPNKDYLQPGLSCAERQEQWEKLKQQCDEADWKTLECLSYLGVSTNCLELVQPTPDGENACLGLSRNPSAFEVEQSLCGSNWLLPDGFGNFPCIDAVDVSDYRLPDPCHDPRINWGPDNCIPRIIHEVEKIKIVEAGMHLSRIPLLNTEQFNEALGQMSHPVLTIFSIETCAPCQRTLEIIESLMDEYENRLEINKVDINKNRDLAFRFNITHTPTIMVFANGENVGHRRVGYASPERLKRYLDLHAAAGTKRKNKRNKN